MDAEECRELHQAIEEGNLALVSRLIENHSAEQYFLHEGESALYRAFSCKDYEIAAHLISKGASLHKSEKNKLYRLEIDLTRVNHLLLHCNKKSGKSCIFRLISLSQSPQGLDGERLKAVNCMYENLFESKIIKLLMMVLETVALDVFYDFESEKVNRLHRPEVYEMEIFGLTLTNSKEIFIGAKNLMSGDPKKRAKVYGVVAEELCHLALTNMFENAGKPYKEEQTELSEEFKNITKAVRSLAGRSCHIESSIKTIFTDYAWWQWECELIARVPHVIGIYGEETGRGILMESSELSRLLSFYEENVVPMCRMCTDPTLNTKSHRKMGELMEKHSLITSEERRIKPLKEGFPSFRKYLQDFPSFPEHPDLKREGISMLTTNCTKLCTLQVFHELKEDFLKKKVFHELKQEYGDLLKKKVLFLSRKCFEREEVKIVDAFKGNVWEYLIIVMDKKELKLWEFHRDYLNRFLSKEMNIILITSTQSTDDLRFNFERALNYKWDDLAYEYKDKLEKITFLFKGQEEHVTVEKGDFPKYFNEEEILQIIDEVFEVDDGKDLNSPGYHAETYVERAFTATTVNRKFFDNIPGDTSVILSGFSEKDFEEGLKSEIQVQWLYKSDAIMQEDKSVYICRGYDFTTFSDLVGKNPRKSTIWLHQVKQVFYLINSDSTTDEFKKHTKEVPVSEKEILDFLKIKRILIISDNAGCGKSTVVSSLISTVRKNRSDSWIWRIDFNKFSNSEKDPLSLAHLKSNSTDEEVIDHLCLMLGLKGGFEKYLFKKFSCSEEILENEEKRCFIFFDGYDEIPSKYMNSALKILSTLNQKTAVNLIITTRKHHQEELEKALGTYSHRLVPLSEEYQKEFLNKLWKNKLKDPKGKRDHRSQRDVTEKIQNIIVKPRKEDTVSEYQELIHSLKEIDLKKNLNSILSDIENLDFRNFAEFILENSSLDKETVEFIGIPLHLYMIGSIHLINNFNVDTAYDIYSLYKEFLDQKILIYIEEKQNLRKEGDIKEKMVKITRENAFRIHTKLSIQLIYHGKVCQVSDLDEDEDDLKLCIGLGVVYEHGGEIRFLHQTFAEFFMAESVRKNVRKRDIIKLISDDKYKVIRRFLSSSLEKNSFGKVSNGLLKVSCLTNIMVQAKKKFDTGFRPNTDTCSSVKIVKSLLVNFEQNVEVSVVNKLIDEIESRSESIRDVGGFLTVQMMKQLLNRNFERNSYSFLQFVRFAGSVDEVMDVLRECIPSGSDGGPGSSLDKRSKRREDAIDKEDQDRLELLLRKKDFHNRGLLWYAMKNERVEIYAHMLKFFRDRLGKEQFLESVEYKGTIFCFIFLDYGYINIGNVCSFFKAFHNVFDKEIQILIDDDLIHRIFNSLVSLESVLPFEKVINIFQECLDSEQLKEQLLRCNKYGDSLIQEFIRRCPLTQMVKNLITIEKVLKDKMKQFLTSINKYGSNALHVAVKEKDKYFVEIIQYFGNYLEKEELKELLFCEDLDHKNVIHFLFENNSTEILIDNLNSIKGIIGEENMKMLLKSKNSHNQNIFHFAAFKDRILDFQFFKDILGKDDTKKLLLSKAFYDRNVIHLLFENNSTKILIENLNSIKGVIGKKNMKMLLKSKNSHNQNIFHFAAFKDRILDFQFFKDILGKDDTKKLLLSKAFYDQNVIHCLFRSNSTKILIDNLNSIKGVIGKKNMKMLLKSKSCDNQNIFHFAAYGDRILDFQFFKNILGKDDTKELLLSKTYNDRNVIHLLFENNSTKILIENLNSIKGVIGKEDMKMLLKSKNSDNQNIFHFAAFKDRILDFQFFKDILGKDDTKELLLSKANYDRNVIHLLFENNSTKILIENLNSIKGIIGEEDMKMLLKSKNSHNQNIFHFAALKDRILEFQFFKDILGKDDTKKLLLSKAFYDQNVIHCLFRSNSTKILIDNLNSIKGVIGKEDMKMLLKSKNSDNQNIFHFAAFKDRILDFQFFKDILGKDDTKELLLSKANYDRNVIHLLFENNSTLILIDNLKSIEGMIGKEDLKRLLKSKNSDNENILHIAAYNFYIEFTFLHLFLCESEIADLLLERNKFGRTCLHSAVRFGNVTVIIYLIDYAHQFLKCDSRSEEFLLAQDEDGNTFLHFMIESSKPVGFSRLRTCIASNGVFNKLLRVRNYEGKTFLQINADDIEVIIEYYVKGILEKDLLEELLKENEKEITQEEH